MHVTCDGFEVETLINVRVARAGLAVAEVASSEHERLHGDSKLRAVRDGVRVLRTILVERARPHRPADEGTRWHPAYRELPSEEPRHDRDTPIIATRRTAHGHLEANSRHG